MELWRIRENKTISILVIFTLVSSSLFIPYASATYPTKATSDFGFIQIDRSEYDVSYTSSAIVKVNGTVNHPQQGDDKVVVVFRAPDGSTSGAQIAIAWNGFFQTELPLDYNSQKGTYTVFASYSQAGIGAISFTVKQIPANTLPNSNHGTNTTNQQSSSKNQNTQTQKTTPPVIQPSLPQNQVTTQNQIPNSRTAPITISGELKPSDIFSLAKPGTVLIFTIINSTMKIPVPQFQSQRLTDFISTEVNEGILDPNDEQAAVQAGIDEVVRNPDIYIIPTSQYTTTPLSLTMEGSGFILNQEGYVVTNAHVIGASDQNIRSELAKQAANIIINSTATSFSQSNSLTQNQRAELALAYIGYILKNVQMGEVNKNVIVIAHDYSDQPVTFTSQVITAGGEIPDKDVAILKMSGGNFSPLPLGDDKSLSVGDKLYVLGYPGAATFMSYLSTSSYTEPTFTSGVVSAKKTMSGGWAIVQTDASMTHGNSGGPVFDSTGKVIGIATFVTVDPNTGQELSGLNFVVPTSVIKEFVSSAGTTYIQDYPGMNSGKSAKSQTSPSLPQWLKNNAKWWSQGSISDSQFVVGIQYLIQRGIIVIPSTTSQGSGTNQIPQWIKNNAGWWADGQISDDDFIKGLQYLASNGILKVKA